MTRKEKIISISALVFLGLAVVALLIALLLTGEREPRVKSVSYFDYFDTVITVYDYSGDTVGEFNEKCAEIERIMKKYHELCDIYHTYPGITNAKDINDSAGGDGVKVSEELFELLEYSKQMHGLTDGALNIAFGAVLRVWHEYRTEAAITKDTQDNRLPTIKELTEAAKHCDISTLVLDRETLTVTLTDPLASIDLGAVAKGYATERAREALISMGADGYAIDAGGNIRLIGERSGSKPWSIGVRDPFGDGVITNLELKDTASVTSGGYERYYTVEGKRYHHIINGETLMPAEFFASVTVIHPDSGLADCLSTALFNSSYEDALAILDRIRAAGLGEAEVVFITPSGEIIRYPA